MLGWGWYGLHKKIADTRYVKLVLLYLVGSMGHVVHSGASRAQNVDALFIVLGQDRYRFYKKCVRTRYAEHVFLHLVGLAGHVMHSGAFGPWTSTHYFSYSGGTGTDSTKSALGHVTPNLCLCITWCIPVRPGHEMSTQYFSWSGGLGAVSIKSASGHVTPNL
jgi:hypothetical protein